MINEIFWPHGSLYPSGQCTFKQALEMATGNVLCQPQAQHGFQDSEASIHMTVAFPNHLDIN